MNHRAVVTVATGRYVRGAERLLSILAKQHEDAVHWVDCLPPNSPTHEQVPYAFKSYALKEAEREGYTTLLWADASIKPIASLAPIWERIERYGYWFSRNGWSNDQWTADSAYPDLFPEHFLMGTTAGLEPAREKNSKIEHVVATTFGIDLTRDKGRAFLCEYFRLASTTKAFCGPWTNGPWNGIGNPHSLSLRQAVCGPKSTLGHRHDQSAASVIAWRLGFKLTDPPVPFCYSGGEKEGTILCADGSY